MKASADFIFSNYGTVVMVRPTTSRARRHLAAFTNGTWYHGELAVEWRFAADLAIGLRSDGYVVGAA